jgi:tetratricopeptide (TPR) repeat protein
MDERRYKLLMRVAIVLTIAWIAWSLYDSGLHETTAEARDVAAARRLLEDGQFNDALLSYEKLLGAYPEHLGALRGKAQALMQLGAQEALQAHRHRQQGREREADSLALGSERRYREALNAYDEAIQREEESGISEPSRSILGVSYANRGILKDRMGDYRGALSDYRKSMELYPEVTEGPGFLTRFMRNQADKPPTVADRAGYLEQQLARPESERLLWLPEQDAAQRSYKID